MRAYWDLEAAPPTYDFFGFLMCADNFRRRRGADFIDVVIVPGPWHGFRKDNLPPDDPAWRRTMLEDCVIKGARLCPYVRSVVELPRHEALQNLEGNRFPEQWPSEPTYYGLSRMVEALSDDEFEGLRALSTEYLPERSVTITLRESHYWPSRNSDMPEWLQMARWLTAYGYHPIFIRDSEKTGSIEGHDTRFGIDTHQRAAIYEAAAMNLFTMNGPLALCMFNKKTSYIVCKKPSADAPAVSDGFYAANGISIGGQFPNAGHKQRLVWDNDRFEVIRDAFIEAME